MGFLELRWGKDGFVRADSKSEDRSPLAQAYEDTAAGEALQIIKDSYAEAVAAATSVEARSAKLSWVGGAVRVYALFTGRSGEEVLAEVKAAAPLPAPAPPALPAEMFKMTKPEDRTNRPPRAPGAQRSLTPEELSQPPAQVDSSTSITAAPLRTSTD